MFREFRHGTVTGFGGGDEEWEERLEEKIERNNQRNRHYVDQVVGEL